jgi:hypothetical protein
VFDLLGLDGRRTLAEVAGEVNSRTSYFPQ